MFDKVKQCFSGILLIHCSTAMLRLIYQPNIASLLRVLDYRWQEDGFKSQCVRYMIDESLSYVATN